MLARREAHQLRVPKFATRHPCLSLLIALATVGVTAVTWHHLPSQPEVILSTERAAKIPFTVVDKETHTEVDRQIETAEKTNIQIHNFETVVLPEMIPPATRNAKQQSTSPAAEKKVPGNATLAERSLINYTAWISGGARCLTALSRSPEIAICCLKRIRESLSIGLTQKDRVELEEAGFGTEFINNLPHTDIPRFNTCAVVSSASSLKKHKFGQEIDAHDAVFRLNHAPTTGFEDIVGSKTTIRLINSHVQRNIVMKQQEILGLGDTVNTTLFVRDTPSETSISHPNFPANWNKAVQVLTHYVTLRRMRHKVYLNHPIFALFAGRTLLTSFGFTHFKATSSGFQGVVLATLLCNYVTSYEVATNDPMSKMAADYYFVNKRLNMPHYHPIRQEGTVLANLGKQRDRSWVYDIELANRACK